jgi:hypothetical protein
VSEFFWRFLAQMLGTFLGTVVALTLVLWLDRRTPRKD